jgi:hypothetical protein
LFIFSEAAAKDLILGGSSPEGEIDKERMKKSVIEYLTAHPNSVFNNSVYYPPQDIPKKPMVVRCERCNQEVKTHKNGPVTVITPCPCPRGIRFSQLPGTFNGDIDWCDFSVQEVLPDGTTREMIHTPTDKELEAWRGPDGRK